jgi:hypothetical protein
VLRVFSFCDCSGSSTMLLLEKFRSEILFWVPVSFLVGCHFAERRGFVPVFGFGVKFHFSFLVRFPGPRSERLSFSGSISFSSTRIRFLLVDYRSPQQISFLRPVGRDWFSCSRFSVGAALIFGLLVLCFAACSSESVWAPDQFLPAQFFPFSSKSS